MNVSLNWIRQYIDLPADLTAEDLATDLTMRTVEVESVTNPADRVRGIVTGRIESVETHPEADLLRICQVDIGGDRLLQIVCGGTNLYAGERVAVAPPGAFVRWHGQGEPVELKAVKLRGQLSEGMICSSQEIDLEDLFPTEHETIILDLTPLFPQAEPGLPLADLLELHDLIIEIDNKSMTNRPDLWGHYGIARELVAIYGGQLKELPAFELPQQVQAYAVEILDPDRCRRYDAVVFDQVANVPSPFWMQRLIWSVGMRPINLLVDITNYVMLATGQPTHAFDRDHVEEGIRVRRAREGEILQLLDGHELHLADQDLLICDGKDKVIGLAGVMGGARDSILPETSGMVLEVANFEAIGIRKTAGRHQLRTEASSRFEKSIDTPRCDQALGLTLALMRELQPQARIVAAGHHRVQETKALTIPLSLSFLKVRSGRDLTQSEVMEKLAALGFETSFDGQDQMTVTVPVWRATGDVSIRDDILEEVCRMIGYDRFVFVPPLVRLDQAVRQPVFESSRAIRDYLASRAGLQEVFTYPWTADRFLMAAGEEESKHLTLANPPSPERSRLRSSLIPGLLEAVSLNARYYDNFGLFEWAQCFEPGKAPTDSSQEALPLQKRKLSLALAGQEAGHLFRSLKGILEDLPRYGRVQAFTFARTGEKPAWADRNAWLDLMGPDGQRVGRMGLLSPKATAAAGLRQIMATMAEIEVDLLQPLASRDNRYQALPHFPLVEQDLAIVVEEAVSWTEVEEALASHVRRSEFLEEYRGSQVPEGKKSLIFRFWLGSEEKTLSSEEIEEIRQRILKKLKFTLKADLR
ncbi:MAG: phenylalanine--tRNA ligase subunit beta [Saccharofermentanales bacterium]